MSSVIEIDRKMLDFLAGIDTELNELVEGSNLYKPTIDLANVILPDEQKKLILDTVNNYEAYVLLIRSRIRLISGLFQIHSMQTATGI